MKSVFIQEQKRYLINDLCSKCDCSTESIINIIRKLKEYGVLKVVKASDKQKRMSDLYDEDIQVCDVIPDDGELYYVFTFVGVIICSVFIFKCYPKYISNKEPEEELKQILQVLRKSDSDNEIIRTFSETSDSKSFNLLAVLLFLINDFYENGIYSTSQNVIESNGAGEILWDRTINETFMFLSNDRPVYVEFLTQKNKCDQYDYIRRLHMCVLTIASRELENAGILSLFDITRVELSDESLDDFGEKDFILYKISKELNVQFNTRKILILKILYTYIDKNGHLNDVDSLSAFGTNSFNLVWEKVLKIILNNQLELPLDSLKLPVNLKQSDYDKQTKLGGIIEKPHWTITEKDAEDTLIPDIITIRKIDNEYKFIIVDAKYYVPKLEHGQVPKAIPGIESVTKQYLYQLAYKKFTKDHNIDFDKSIINCFIMPTDKEPEDGKAFDKGDVSMKMFEPFHLQNIKVRLFPAKTAFDKYLSGGRISVEDLRL